MATKLQKPQIVEDDETYSEAEGLHLWKVFLQVLGFILVILIVPIVGYFISKSYVFEHKLGYSSTESNSWAAGVAIVLVHIALAAFLYVAFSAKPKTIKKD